MTAVGEGEFPDEVETYVRQALWERRSRPACLSADTSNRVIGVWGDFRYFGIEQPAPGQDVSGSLPMLADYGYSESAVLRYISVAGGRSFHVHLWRGKACRYALLLDAQRERDDQAALQQRGNELELAYHQQSRLLASLVEARSELENRRREAEEASRRRGELVSTLSHEVRTPLTAIIGYARLLQEAESNAPHVDTIRSAAEQLLGLVNQLLEEARLEADGSLSVKRVISPEFLLESIGALFAPLAAEKGIGFRAELGEDVPSYVRVDPIQLRQILVNLVGNAVKYTEVGHVRLALSFRAERLHFEVWDTGPGIAETDRRRVFDAFEQLDGEAEGAGLGLSIVTDVAQKLGASLDLKSEVGRGSCFSVAVPVEVVELPKSDPNVDNVTRVLVVEDDADIQDLLQLRLDQMGYHVTMVDRGDSVVEAVAATTPDVVVMDLNLPGLSGTEAVRALRADGFEGPVLALSASREAHRIDAALAAGFTEYLFKPLELAELKAAIERLTV